VGGEVECSPKSCRVRGEGGGRCGSEGCPRGGSRATVSLRLGHHRRRRHAPSPRPPPAHPSAVFFAPVCSSWTRPLPPFCTLWPSLLLPTCASGPSPLPLSPLLSLFRLPLTLPLFLVARSFARLRISPSHGTDTGTLCPADGSHACRRMHAGASHSHQPFGHLDARSHSADAQSFP